MTDAPAPTRWGRVGLLNTLEHALTRFSDSATTLLLLWGLSSELFGRLAIAQAFAAPLLLLCVAPENVLYRDFPALRGSRGTWREDRGVSPLWMVEACRAASDRGRPRILGRDAG